jgi:hypothetical protein
VLEPNELLRSEQHSSSASPSSEHARCIIQIEAINPTLAYSSPPLQSEMVLQARLIPPGLFFPQIWGLGYALMLTLKF